jgi:hypothetical protein
MRRCLPLVIITGLALFGASLLLISLSSLAQDCICPPGYVQQGNTCLFFDPQELRLGAAMDCYIPGSTPVPTPTPPPYLENYVECCVEMWGPEECDSGYICVVWPEWIPGEGPPEYDDIIIIDTWWCMPDASVCFPQPPGEPVPPQWITLATQVGAPLPTIRRRPYPRGVDDRHRHGPQHPGEAAAGEGSGIAVFIS